ncbi:MAG: sigma-70 family RNA polymerase sigma factor [Anaerolineae bacterium]
MIVIVLPDIETEDQLLARARQGDRHTITEIYNYYFEPIYQFVQLRVDDLQTAEDIVSEVFLKLIKTLQTRQAPRKSLRGWLFRVARNVLHDHYGKQRRLNTTALEEWLPLPDSHHPEAQFLQAAEAQAVREALRRLPDEQQEVLILRFGQRLTLQETADIMGRSVSAIKSLQFRATDNLRKQMQVRKGSLQ